MKHYGEYEREPVILLGYNKPSGRMLLIPLPQLNEVQQQFLAGVVRNNLNKNESIIPALQRETYNGGDAFSYFGSFAIQVPLHFVKMADRSQAEELTGSSAQFSERVLPHAFIKLVTGKDGPYGSRAPETPLQPAPTADPAPLWHAGNDGAPPAAASNDDLTAIRMMMSTMMERLAQVEQNQLAQASTPAYPNLGPFAAAETSDASGKQRPETAAG